MVSWSQFIRLLVISVLCSIKPPASYAFQEDSLYHRLSATNDDSTRVAVLIALSKSFSIPRDKARSYALQALDISEQNKYRYGIALSNFALIDFAKSPTEVENYTQKALRLFKKTGNRYFESNTYLRASAQYLSVSPDYISALKYARKFLSVNGDRENPDLLARCWNLIGEVYRISKNYGKALEAYSKSASYVHETPDNQYLSPFINKGTVYKDVGHYEKALDEYDSILTFLSQNGLTESNTYAYLKNRKAQVLLLQRNYDVALQEARESLQLYTTLNFDRGKVLALGTLAEVYFDIKQPDRCIEAGTQAIEIAIPIGFVTEGIDNVCRIVANAYARRGNYAMAYQYEMTYSALTTTMYSPESYIALANEQVKLETEKQELENQLLQERSRTAEAAIEKQRAINLIVIATLIIMLIFSFFLFKNMRSKHRLNLQLKEKQDEVLQQSEELKAQAEELQTYNEKIRHMNNTLEDMVLERTEKINQQNKQLIEYAHLNAHNLRGPLARILGLVYLMERDLPNDGYGSYKKMLKEAGEEMDKVVAEIKLMLESKK